MTYDLGDRVKLSTVVKNDAGTPVNTPTVVIAVTRPDGTVVSPAPTVTNTGAGGVYTAELAAATVNQAGLWTYVWTASGTVEATDDQQFDVRADRTLVASLEELKSHLRWDDTDTEDLRLKDILTAVTDLMEPAIGPVAPRTFTEYHQLEGAVVVPRRRPLVSVTSITPDQGTAVDTSNFLVDTDVSLVRMRIWLCGLYTVVYRAGHNPWPAALKYAGLIICQHEWRVRNGPAGRPAPDVDALAMMPGVGYLVPHRALELMRPFLLPAVA